MKVAYKEKIIPEAFHGTHRENAIKIINEGFIVGHRQDPFLGEGAYFYESCLEHAYEWADKHICSTQSDIGVICACINLGKCLELHNSQHIAWLQLVWKMLDESGVEEITDAVVINFYATHFDEIDTVRATQIVASQKRKKIFLGSRFYSSQKIVICVRNLRNILSLNMVYDGRDGNA